MGAEKYGGRCYRGSPELFFPSGRLGGDTLLLCWQLGTVMGLVYEMPVEGMCVTSRLRQSRALQ